MIDPTRTLFAFSLVAGLALLAADTALASDEARQQRGNAVYQQHCAVCHGASGAGDGPFVEELKTAPSDITRIAERRDGVFPAAQLSEIIDGRRRTRGHGPRTMPIWGKKFGPDVAAGSADRSVAQDQILTLVEFLRSIQREAPSESSDD